jgi:hypothetical protein
MRNGRREIMDFMTAEAMLRELARQYGVRPRQRPLPNSEQLAQSASAPTAGKARLQFALAVVFRVVDYRMDAFCPSTQHGVSAAEFTRFIHEPRGPDPVRMQMDIRFTYAGGYREELTVVVWSHPDGTVVVDVVNRNLPHAAQDMAHEVAREFTDGGNVVVGHTLGNGLMRNYPMPARGPRHPARRAPANAPRPAPSRAGGGS